MRYAIAIGILILWALVIWYVWHDDPPKQVDPRTYRCEVSSGLACEGMGK